MGFLVDKDDDILISSFGSRNQRKDYTLNAVAIFIVL